MSAPADLHGVQPVTPLYEHTTPLIQGQVLRLSARRQVAIYLRDDTLWIAEFVDGKGEITDAKTWFRFNCASALSSYMRRRMLLESAIPLSFELAEKVERLHRAQFPASALP